MLSLGLLLIFIISITPTLYLHEIFAGHSDASIAIAKSPGEQVRAAGFACDCDSLVATSPFTEIFPGFVLRVASCYKPQILAPIPAHKTQPRPYLELRGPPESA